MDKYAKKTTVGTQAFNLPDRCGVTGCKNKCDVYIKEKNVARCSEHYQKDVDDWGKNHRRGSSARFSAEPEIIKTLEHIGLIQRPDESIREFGQRCKIHVMQTAGSGFNKLLNAKYGN